MILILILILILLVLILILILILILMLILKLIASYLWFLMHLMQFDLFSGVGFIQYIININSEAKYGEFFQLSLKIFCVSRFFPCRFNPHLTYSRLFFFPY